MGKRIPLDTVFRPNRKAVKAPPPAAVPSHPEPVVDVTHPKAERDEIASLHAALTRGLSKSDAADFAKFLDRVERDRDSNRKRQKAWRDRQKAKQASGTAQQSCAK